MRCTGGELCRKVSKVSLFLAFLVAVCLPAVAQTQMCIRDRIESVQISGLMAEIRISIGDQQITSIITARSAREMQLKRGQTAAVLIKATDVMILRV